jgi:toxin YhaV
VTRDRRPKPPAAGVGHAHGWALFAHPLFLDQLEALLAEVEAERKKDPSRPPTSPNAKVLSAIASLIFDRIPQDPTRKEFRQGDTLGAARKHWFRAKFGGGRFRLFFRFRADARVIVYAWVNDESTLRTYGSRTDAYAVFARMLDGGNPPEDWDALLAVATREQTQVRAARAMKRLK